MTHVRSRRKKIIIICQKEKKIINKANDDSGLKFACEKNFYKMNFENFSKMCGIQQILQNKTSKNLFDKNRRLRKYAKVLLC